MADNKNNFIMHGSILALAGIMVRVIGLMYRIPLTNILGDVAMGYYSVAYDIYSLFLLISSMSIPIAVSKLVSARVAKHEMKNAYRILVGSLMFSMTISLIASLLMFFGARTLASAAKYSEASYAIKILAPTLFIMSILGVLRGYFQGVGSTIPTAISQIIEQIVNAAVSISAGIYMINLGKTLGREAAYGAAGGTAGTLMGAAAALIFMCIVFAVYKSVLNRQIRRDRTRKAEPYGRLIRILALTILPVLLGTTIYNFSNLFDSLIFGNVMEKVYGMAEDIRSSLWGIYSSKYRVLTTVPIAFASALSAAIIPSLVRSAKAGGKGDVINKIDSAIKFTMLVAIPSGVGLSMLAGPVVLLLFPSPALYVQSVYLMRFAFCTVIAFSYSTITNAILQGIDRMKVPVINAAASLILHLAIILIFLIPFDMGIYGVVISDIIYGTMISVLNMYSLRKYSGYRQELLKTFILPGIAAGIMGLISYGTHKFLMNVIRSNAICTFAALIVAIITYFPLLILFKAVDEDDLYAVPKGRIIIKIAKKLHLI